MCVICLFFFGFAVGLSVCFEVGWSVLMLCFFCVCLGSGTIGWHEKKKCSRGFEVLIVPANARNYLAILGI